MSLDCTMLQRVKPPDLSAIAVGDWYRDDSYSYWQNNFLWFFRTQKSTIHMVYAESFGNNVVIYDYRWDVGKTKWFLAKPKITVSLWDFFTDFWYKHRLHKNFTAQNGFYAYCTNEATPAQYALEMCIRIYRRIQEYSYYLLMLSSDEKSLLKQFAADMILDFGVMPTLATICLFSDYIARTLMSTHTYRQYIENARKYMYINGFDSSYYNESIINLKTMTDYDVDVVCELLPDVYDCIINA